MWVMKKKNVNRKALGYITGEFWVSWYEKFLNGTMANFRNRIVKYGTTVYEYD